MHPLFINHYITLGEISPSVPHPIISDDDKDILKESLEDTYQLTKQAALDVLENVANKQVSEGSSTVIILLIIYINSCSISILCSSQ